MHGINSIRPNSTKVSLNLHNKIMVIIIGQSEYILDFFLSEFDEYGLNRT